MHFCCQIGCLGQKTTPGSCYSISADASVSGGISVQYACSVVHMRKATRIARFCYVLVLWRKQFFLVKKQSVLMYVSYCCFLVGICSSLLSS
jgi:hypothetical protein